MLDTTKWDFTLLPLLEDLDCLPVPSDEDIIREYKQKEERDE